MKKVIINPILFILLIGSSAFAQSGKTIITVNKFTKIDNLFKQYLDSGWIKGITANIAIDGKTVYNKAFGNQIDRPFRTDDILRIASQTKAVTSVAVMMLFDEGQFTLDDPISKYIVAFKNPKVLDKFNPTDSTYTTKPAKREITIRDLLTHTSGLGYAQIGSPEMNAIYAKSGIEAGFVINKKLLKTEINKLGKLPLEINPGQKWQYSLGMDVLGRLVEVTSGLSLDRFFKERIFNPLGMTDTYFALPKDKQNRLATVYTEDEKNHVVKPWKDGAFPGATINYPINNNGYFAGGAGLVSTSKDYGIFLQMLLNDGELNGKRILSKRSVDLMTINQIGKIPFGDNSFGLGFEITTDKGSKKLGQSAGSYGWGGFFGSTYWVDPKKKMVAQIYVQQWPLSHGDVANKFKSLIYQALK
ncbi:class A beta-lactamase-related serine hydrolase [Pedobacter frigidisoli]|uniref:Class A beta-lactamase-related serine hydrolase n=1 Tax=Pedobacter frigidisoli TaxID=2530455 RepID=A0A4R0P3Z6_9SPHI|nr:serine hydrolase domain-containing protein [Pedobacter frigidisoli]TCD08508.1 class A beta-lactamase-related serine hydrolase [Pedobacter frigidisoli]